MLKKEQRLDPCKYITFFSTLQFKGESKLGGRLGRPTRYVSAQSSLRQCKLLYKILCATFLPKTARGTHQSCPVTKASTAHCCSSFTAKKRKEKAFNVDKTLPLMKSVCFRAAKDSQSGSWLLMESVKNKDRLKTLQLKAAKMDELLFRIEARSILLPHKVTKEQRQVPSVWPRRSFAELQLSQTRQGSLL